MNEQKIKLEDLEELFCPCGHNRFKSVISMRKISPIYTGKDRPVVEPIPIIVCEKCDKIFEAPQIIS